MLQILWLILKIIGIIIAVILGILVLLLCIVLLAPVHYKGSAESDGGLEKIRADIRVTWLLRLLSFQMNYEENQLRWRFRVAWKTFGQENEDEVDDYEKITVEEEKETVSESAEDLEESEEKIPEETAQPEKHEERVEEDPEDLEKIKARSLPEKERTSEASAKEKKSLWEKAVYKAEQIKKKIIGFLKKIKYTFQRICDRIKVLSDKKEKLKQFVTDERHRHAFSVFQNAVFRFLKRICPGKIQGRIHFGFEDPSYTGRVLAGLAVVYPFTGNHLRVEPDFENRVLKGSISWKGSILILDAAILVWKLFWCRDVRATYRDIKSFEL